MLTDDTDFAEKTALLRYRVIAEALPERLTPIERGLIVRDLAERSWELDGRLRRVSRSTIDRWITAYRERGLAGLKPQPRRDRGVVRKRPELMEEACRLRRELPSRSAPQISRILGMTHGVAISPRTIRGHLQRQGLTRAELGQPARAFGRFEAERPNQLWIGDTLFGPLVPDAGKSLRAYLFLFVDDHSRLLVHGRFLLAENARGAQLTLREAILRRGLPEVLYLDNGSPFSNAALERSCAVLGIRLIHSKPYSPQGRGKLERLNRFIRERFLAEAEAAGITGLQQLNDRLLAWVDQECNTRLHAETHQTPISRFEAAGPPRDVDLDKLADAFKWSVVRAVTRTAEVSLRGSRYSVDPALVGRQVEVRYDPEDLTSVEIWCERMPWGKAFPTVLGRHVRKRPESPPAPPGERTGVDFLGLVERAHDQQTLGRLSYRDLLRDPKDDQQEGKD
jgi:putative transposase